MNKIKKYSHQELEKLKQKIYQIFPPYYPNRPVFNPQMRSHFGYENDIARAEFILSSPRETIDWPAYSEVNQEATSYIFMFSNDFYKYVFPSLLAFCVSPESILPSGGVNILVGSFMWSHLDTEELYTDWELEFLLSLDDSQSRIVADVLKIHGEDLILERYWGGYL
jgi:hypothetical protein